MARMFPRMGLAAAAVAAVLLSSTAGVEAATRGGKMVYGRYADSLFLDPVLNDANVDIWVMNNLYDTLLSPTKDGLGVEPGLATKWEITDDGRSVVLTIRPDVKFADGTPLTAEDVKWSLDRARDPKAGAWNASLASIDSIDVRDPGTVVLKLKNPDPTILPALATFNSAVMPKKLFEAAQGGTSEEKAKSFAERPVGTGPFLLTDWKRGVSMTLKRNPHYWKQGEDGKPLPYLDELEFQIIPDDATRLLKLKAGEIDGTEFVPYARVQELKSDPNLRMELWPSTRVAYLTMNVRPNLKDGKPNPLSDVKVRQALNFAVNKPAIIQITTLGLGKPMNSFMSSTTPLFYGPSPLYPYDVNKAKALMKEAGFADGFEMACLALSGNGDDANNLTAVQQMFGQLGVKLRIDQVDNGTRTARYREADFQCRTAAWTNDISDPSQITSYFAYFPNIESLHSGYQDKRIDELFLKSQQENNPEARRAQYKEIQEIYNAAAPIIYLYETPYPVAFRSKAKGFVQIPLGNNLFEAAYVEK